MRVNRRTFFIFSGVNLPTMAFMLRFPALTTRKDQDAGKAVPSQQQERDLVLEGDRASTLVERLRDFMPVMHDVATNPGRSMHVRLPLASGDEERLLFSLAANPNIGPRRYLRVQRRDGETAYFACGNTLNPFLRVTDANGRTVFWNAKPLEFSLPWEDKAVWRDPRSMIQAGAAIAGLALALWLGVVATKIIMAILGFIAFYLIVGGLLLVAGAVVVHILEKAGVNMEWLKNLAAAGKEALMQMVGGIMQRLRKTSGEQRKGRWT